MNAVKPVPLRRTLYFVLIAVAAGTTGGRILSIVRVYEPTLFRPQTAPAVPGIRSPYDPRQPWPAVRPEPMPTFGSNDRARWATIRALVDDGTYAIGYRTTDPATGKYQDHGIIAEDGWQTIDKVLRPDTQQFYASKPPLLPTLLAGEYWLLKKTFGWSLADEHDRWLVVRTILFTVNWLPFLVYLALLARLVDRYGTTDWGRLYVMAAACFGTFLTTFATTLNNHSIAAYCAVFALYPLLTWRRESTLPTPTFSQVMLSGFFAGFTACNELPAAAFAAGLGLVLFLRFPWRTIFGFVPAAAVPVAALVLTNYLAIGQVKLAYFEHGSGSSWYEYEGSPWQQSAPAETKRGIDWAKDRESRAVYVLHFLVGHHGLFSLSPIYLLTVAGLVLLLTRQRGWDGSGPLGEPRVLDGLTLVVSQMELRLLAGLTLAVSVVVIGFYLFIVGSRNYGGVTSGPRWLFWLTPLWLLMIVPAADALAPRRWGRGLALVSLAVSVLSVSYPAWNPWRHPWLYNLFETQGWIHY